jgi:hypothetical protein
MSLCRISEFIFEAKSRIESVLQAFSTPAFHYQQDN